MKRRQAFTITELLVAMALIMFIMAVLSEAFIAGLESFRQLKAIGDMDQRLQVAATLLRRDLDANWLQVTTGNNIKLSSLNTTAPISGFFVIAEDSGSAGLDATKADKGIDRSSPGPYKVYLTSPTPPNLSNLGPNMPVMLSGAPGADTERYFTDPSYVAGSNPILLTTAPAIKQFTTAQWWVPNGLYDNSGGPGPSPVSDLDGLSSPLATTFKLYFSVDLSVMPTNTPTYKPRRRENYFAASAPGTVSPFGGPGLPILSPLVYVNPIAPFASTNGVLRPPFEDGTNYLSQKAEVAYFLRPNNSTALGGTKLYSLYRRQLALLDNTTDDNTLNTTMPSQVPPYIIPVPPFSQLWPNSYSDFSGIPSASRTYMQFNTLAAVSNPKNRCLTYAFWNYAPVPPGWGSIFPILGERNEPLSVQGADLLLTDVVSFSLRILPKPAPATSYSDPFFFPGFIYMANDGTSHVVPPGYDTSFVSGFPANVAGIQALELLIRVWDQKTSRTRQITIIQPM